MHDQARQFTLFCQKQFPSSFSGKIVFDIGSGDINGNNRFLFDEKCVYAGNDVFAGNNVTLVMKTKDLPFAEHSFDTIISTECFEHDPEYALSFKRIVSVLKKGGLFVFTCASLGRPEHGTLRTSPEASFGTIGNVEGWSTYYKNLTFDDFDSIVDVKATFQYYASYYNAISQDLYFWGIKKGDSTVYNIPPYVAPGVRQLYSFPIKILSATFGTRENNIDVTEKFKSAFCRGNAGVEVPTFTNLLTLFGDPAVGQYKELMFQMQTAENTNQTVFVKERYAGNVANSYGYLQ